MNRKAFVTLAIAIFTTMTGMSILSPLMSIYATQMGATGFWLGVMFSGFSLSRALFQPVSGWLSDKYNRKTLLIVGLAAYTVISIAYAIASTLYTLTTVRLLHGLASALVTPVAQAYVGDIIPKGKEGVYMNIFMMSMYLGMAAGPIMGGSLNDLYGMNMAFYVMAAITAIALLLIVIFVPSAEGHAKKNVPGLKSMVSVLKDNRMKAVTLHLCSRAILRQGITSFLPLFAMKLLGMSTTTIGMVISVYIFTEAISQGVVGPFSDRFNKKLLVIGGSLISAVLAFFLNNMTDSIGLLALLVPIAATASIARAAASTYCVEVGAELKSMGGSMGISNASQDLGNFIGPILFGWVTDNYGLSSMFFTGGVTGIIAVPFIVWALYARQPHPSLIQTTGSTDSPDETA